MYNPKFKIGDTVYIKSNEVGSEELYYSNTENSSSTKIIHMRSGTEYPYIVECSKQGWKEHSLEFVKKPVKSLADIQSLQDYEKMHDQDFGTILKLPTGYVFSNPVIFVPIKLKEIL